MQSRLEHPILDENRAIDKRRFSGERTRRLDMRKESHNKLETNLSDWPMKLIAKLGSYFIVFTRRHHAR